MNDEHFRCPTVNRGHTGLKTLVSVFIRGFPRPLEAFPRSRLCDEYHRKGFLLTQKQYSKAAEHQMCSAEVRFTTELLSYHTVCTRRSNWLIYESRIKSSIDGPVCMTPSNLDFALTIITNFMKNTCKNRLCFRQLKTTFLLTSDLPSRSILTTVTAW